MSSPSQTTQISALISGAKSGDAEVYWLQLTNNTVPTDDDTNADDTLQGSDAFLLGGDATDTGTSTANNTIPTDDDTNADAVLQGSDASLLGSNATGTGTASFPRTEATARQYVDDDTTIEGDTSSGDDPIVADNSSTPVENTASRGATASLPPGDEANSEATISFILAAASASLPHGDASATSSPPRNGDSTIEGNASGGDHPTVADRTSIPAASGATASFPRSGDETISEATISFILAAAPASLPHGDASATSSPPRNGDSTASATHSHTTQAATNVSRQYVDDDTTIEGDTSSGDDPSHLPAADNTSVPATSCAPATSTIPCADPTASVTQLPYARLYRQYLDDDTIVGGDGTIPDSSIAAGSDTSASLPRAGDETLDNVTATPALGDATASATSPQAATSVVSGARSWFGVAPMTFALVAVLALLLSSADYSAYASISDQGSLGSWGFDRAVGYVRAYVRQRVRRRVHSGLNPVLSWLSPRVIRWLPTGIIPPQQISRLPLDYIASLPIEYLAEQPVEIIARLPPELISRLPTPVISELPVSSIRQLHLSPTRWLSVGVHAWQRLLSTVAYSVVSHLPSWAPAPFTAWLLRFSLCFASIMVCRFIIEQVLMYVVGLLRRLHRRFGRRG